MFFIYYFKDWLIGKLSFLTAGMPIGKLNFFSLFLSRTGKFSSRLSVLKKTPPAIRECFPPEDRTADKEETTVPDYDFISALEATCKNVEPDFIRMGQKLEAIYADTAELTRKISETVSHIGGESDENLLGRVEQLTKETLENLKNCHTRVSRSLNHVKAFIGHLGELYTLCSAGKKTATFLGVVGFNIGVESSRSSESYQMFNVVSRQIRDLAGKIMTIADSIRKDAETTRAAQLALYDKIYDDFNSLCSLTDEVREAVQASVQEIEQLMAISVQTLEQAGGHSREISRQVGEIVAGIQIHDSMSQRVNHIIAALYDVGNLCAENREPDRAGLAYSVVGLQAAQLKQIIADIDHTFLKSTEAFGRIHSEIDRLAYSFSNFGLGNGEADSQDMFIRLRSAMLHIHELFTRGNTLAERIQEMAARTSETADRLSVHVEGVREISFETHLVSINAIVKSAHLDSKGRILEVLSHEVKTLSDQSDKFANNVSELLEAISAAVRKTGIAGAEEMPCSRGSEVSLESGIQDISEVYDKFKANSSEAFHHSETLKTDISRMIAELDFFPELVRELTELMYRLEDAEAVLLHRKEEKTGNITDEVNSLARRYTMRQERNVHKQVVALPAPDDYDSHISPPLTSPGHEPENEDEDDLGDNVELF